MTSKSPKAQGNGITRPGLTGSLLRNRWVSYGENQPQSFVDPRHALCGQCLDTLDEQLTIERDNL